MKNQSVVLSVLLLFFGLISNPTLLHCEQLQNSSVTINGETKGIQSGTIKVFRINEIEKRSAVLDSAHIINGKFVLSTHLSGTEMVHINIRPGNWSTDILIGPGIISFTADTLDAVHSNDGSNSANNWAILKRVNIVGSKEQLLYNKYKLSYDNKLYLKKIALLNNQLNNSSDESRQIIMSNIEALNNKEVERQFVSIKEFVYENPKSVAALYIFYNYYVKNPYISIKKLVNTLNVFDPVLHKSIYYQELNDVLERKKSVLPGKMAPLFSLKQANGDVLSLDSIKDKFILLDFWASWCKPCREQNSNLMKLYSDFHQLGLEIIGISNDTSVANWKLALSEDKSPWMEVIDEFPVSYMPAKVFTAYQLRWLPSYVLLDRNHKIIASTDSIVEIERVIKSSIKY